MNTLIVTSVVLSALLASCSSDSPLDLHPGAATEEAMEVRAEDWEVPLRYEIGETLLEADSSSFAWVPGPNQAEAILALSEEGLVRLSPDQAARLGASALLLDAAPGAFPVLLRGVRVAPGDGPPPYEADRLSLEWAGSSLRVIHYATRPFPFEKKQARAVLALLSKFPSDVAPVTSIVFTGGVR